MYLDSFILTNGDYHMERDRVQKAVQSIQSHEKFRGVPIIFIPEVSYNLFSLFSSSERRTVSESCSAVLLTPACGRTSWKRRARGS